MLVGTVSQRFARHRQTPRTIDAQSAARRHTALLPVLLKDVYQPLGQFQKAKVALCIHNIAFQVQAIAEAHSLTIDSMCFHDV